MTSKTLFYVAVLAATWLMLRVAKTARLRSALLLLASYVLYASWGITSLVILGFVSVLNYVLGGYLRKNPSTLRLWATIVPNIALLGAFKYLPGLVPTGSPETLLAQIALPVGMSFWTFQALSYQLDLYRGKEMDPSLVEFLLYMSFWPTALSGPICRLPDLLPQIRDTSVSTSSDFKLGLDRIITGVGMTALGQILAGGIRPEAGIDAGFDAAIVSGLRAPDVWCLAIGYGFQLFFNFAGYSHIVIGAARLFGFRLPENFDEPFLATSPSDFWNRWHMSLSSWIRDYLFLPLVMLRREKWWRAVALIVSMLVFGLWHQGTLLFACWGVYQGILLVLHRQWQEGQRRAGWTVPAAVANGAGWLVTFAAIGLGFVLFRAGSMSQAVAMLAKVISPVAYFGRALPALLYATVAAFVVGYFVVRVLAKVRHRFLGPARGLPIEARLALYSVAIYIAFLHTAETQSFVYFRF